MSEVLFKNLLESIGENPQREGLLKTPKRAAEAWKALTQGYQADIPSIVNGALFTSESHDMVVVKDIQFYSLCEHHLLPFYGVMHVGYIPNQKIIGLSKIPRLVEVFTQRLQLQERIHIQLAQAIQEILDPQGVAIVSQASHLCMSMRGVEQTHASTVVQTWRGVFQEPLWHNGFLASIQ